MRRPATRPGRCCAWARSQRNRSGCPRGLAGLLLAPLLAGLLSACAEQALPERRTSADDCLQDLKMDRLKEALQRCDRVVAAFPQDPRPLNDRYLIHTLAGDDRSACRDIARAVMLSRALPPARLDSMLRQDLKVRSEACRGIAIAPQPGGAASKDGGGGAAAPATTPAAAPASPAVQQLPRQNRQ